MVRAGRRKIKYLLAILVWHATGAPAQQSPVQPELFRYERSVSLPPAPGLACALLDGGVFPDAAPSLADLRLVATGGTNGTQELPYAITLSQTAPDPIQSAPVFNRSPARITPRGARLSFDLQMPARPYTAVVLDIDPAVHDFVATAAVTGSDTARTKPTPLGSFTLFDLASRGLARHTTIQLPESSFRLLHIVLSVQPSEPRSARASAMPFSPSMVRAAEVPPSRESQVLYTAVAEAPLTERAQQSTAAFSVPPRLPIERISLVPAPGSSSSFSREVHISAYPYSDLESAQSPTASPERAYPFVETVTGTILRVHTTIAGVPVNVSQLSVPAILGANLQQLAHVVVTLGSPGQPPPPLTTVRLEMRQRQLCFNSPFASGAHLTLFYGGPALTAPAYDTARLFAPGVKPHTAALGPELPNPAFHPLLFPAASPHNPHPAVLWITLFGVVCVIGIVALRSARR